MKKQNSGGRKVVERTLEIQNKNEEIRTQAEKKKKNQKQ